MRPRMFGTTPRAFSATCSASEKSYALSMSMTTRADPMRATAWREGGPSAARPSVQRVAQAAPRGGTVTELQARLDELEELGVHRRMRLVSGPQGPRVVLDGKPVLLLCSD